MYSSDPPIIMCVYTCVMYHYSFYQHTCVVAYIADIITPSLKRTLHECVHVYMAAHASD